MSKKKYVAIGDVHGCYDQLVQLIDKLDIDDDTQLIFLGDYVDRGPSSNKVIEYILELSKKHDVVALRGNHESMMLDFIEDPTSVNAGLFILNGGSATLASYEIDSGQYEIPQEHVEFLKSLKLYYETDDYFFVHAGVPNIPLSQIDANENESDLLWIRSHFLHSSFEWEKVIVHGHTPVDAVEILPSRIGVDTGCVFHGMLSAIELPEKKVISVAVEEPIPHIYLTDPGPSTRRAARFAGNIPITLVTEEGHEQMVCLNYNEFGLLIRDSNFVYPQKRVNDVIQGFIGALPAEPIQFEGKIVRTYMNDGDPFYGIQFFKPIHLNK